MFLQINIQKSAQIMHQPDHFVTLFNHFNFKKMKLCEQLNNTTVKNKLI